jgi:hypothetical protein
MMGGMGMVCVGAASDAPQFYLRGGVNGAYQFNTKSTGRPFRPGISGADLQLIMQHVVGTITEYPDGVNGQYIPRYRKISPPFLFEKE